LGEAASGKGFPFEARVSGNNGPIGEVPLPHVATITSPAAANGKVGSHAYQSPTSIFNMSVIKHFNIKDVHSAPR